MKKNILLTFLSLAGTLCLAQPPHFQFKKNPEVRYKLQVDKTTMEIDANNGARIVSLKYDTTEMLSQINFPNQYGSTFWTSPQKEWNWPPVFEHDMAPYQVRKEGNAWVMTSPLSEKFPLRITKRFEENPETHTFDVTYVIKNESAGARKVAPWEITRVPQVGTIYCEAALNSITGSNGMPGLEFRLNEAGQAQYDIEHPAENRKCNADGKGWLSYVNKNLVLTKQFQDLTPEQVAPDEAEIQVYVDRGGKVVEIESQGPYTELQPGDSLSWTVKWSLCPAK